jgi:hypothetical protein
MNSAENIEQQIKQNKPDTDISPPMDRRILADSIAAMQSARPTSDEAHPHPIWRSIMHSKISKFAAAGILLIATLFVLTLFDKTVTPAYALEYTVQACHSVRFIHIRKFVPQQEEPILVWAEFFEDGQPKSIRLNLPDWASGGDGAKEVVWKDNIAQVWFKKKNSTVRVGERKLADEILNTVREYDPKFAVQNLMHKKESGECEIRIDQPSDKAQPILVTAVTLPDKNKKVVLYVDQATQLPLSAETYQLMEGQYTLENTGEFYDYNQPIDPNMFTFDNLPADVMRVDQVDNVVGLEQGQMTDDEVVLEVVRRFWQAIIDGDYETAGQMLEGVPSSFIEENLIKKLPFTAKKIISIGPVQPHPNPQTRGVVVPCTLEVEMNGQTIQVPFDQIGVRQVYNQPGRWTIFGGL